MHRKPRILDLFCGAGGAAMGYARSGFEVIGVDINPQPNFPFEFHQADALTFPFDGFDAIHASPPCQHYTWSARRWGKEFPDLVDPVRDRLRAWGGLYVMENVIGAPLHNPIVLCGEMFGLRVIRHRLFETNWHVVAPRHIKHRGKVRDGHYVTVAGHGGHGKTQLHLWKAAMGIDWMNRYELTQSIPPAFTEYIGHQLLRTLADVALQES